MDVLINKAAPQSETSKISEELIIGQVFHKKELKLGLKVNGYAEGRGFTEM